MIRNLDRTARYLQDYQRGQPLKGVRIYNPYGVVSQVSIWAVNKR